MPIKFVNEVITTYYSRLGISRNASLEQIKKAYIKLAKQYHPDLNREKEKWATTKFKEINEAYQVLSNPEKRAAYDRQLDLILNQTQVKIKQQEPINYSTRDLTTILFSKDTSGLAKFFAGVGLFLDAYLKVKSRPIKN